MCLRLEHEAATRSPHPGRRRWPFASRHPVRQGERCPLLGKLRRSELNGARPCGNSKPALRIAGLTRSRGVLGRPVGEADDGRPAGPGFLIGPLIRSSARQQPAHDRPREHQCPLLAEDVGTSPQVLITFDLATGIAEIQFIER